MVPFEDKPNKSLAAYLMEQYRYHVPAGIAQRHSENEKFERQLAQEEMDEIVQHLGTLFVFNLPQHLAYLSKTPIGTRAELKEAVKKCVIVGSRKPPRPIEGYSAQYQRYSEEAFSWQEEVQDEDLLYLLKLFRAAVLKMV